MVRTKATVRRMDDFRILARGKIRTIYPFKIKQTLPERKTVNIKKNGQVVKTINVRRKPRSFNGCNRLIFQSCKYISLIIKSFPFYLKYCL